MRSVFKDFRCCHRQNWSDFGVQGKTLQQLEMFNSKISWLKKLVRTHYERRVSKAESLFDDVKGRLVIESPRSFAFHISVKFVFFRPLVCIPLGLVVMCKRMYLGYFPGPSILAFGLEDIFRLKEIQIYCKENFKICKKCPLALSWLFGRSMFVKTSETFCCSDHIPQEQKSKTREDPRASIQIK